MNWSATKSANQRSFGAERWSAIIGNPYDATRVPDEPPVAAQLAEAEQAFSQWAKRFG
jgi:hypothetical protein